MGRRTGACGYAVKTDLSPCGAGPQLSPYRSARQQLPFPEEDPKKIADTEGNTGILCHPGRDCSHPFLRPLDHNHGSTWLVRTCTGI